MTQPAALPSPFPAFSSNHGTARPTGRRSLLSRGDSTMSRSHDLHVSTGLPPLSVSPTHSPRPLLHGEEASLGHRRVPTAVEKTSSPPASSLLVEGRSGSPPAHHPPDVLASPLMDEAASHNPHAAEEEPRPSSLCASFSPATGEADEGLSSGPPPRPDSLEERPRSPCLTPEVSPSLCALVEQEVLTYLIPSFTSLRRRRNQLRCLAEYITDAIRFVGQSQGHPYGDTRFYIFGSVNMRTVLPDGDNDVTVEVDGLLGDDVAPTTTAGPPRSATGSDEATKSEDGKPALARSVAISVAGGELLSRVKDYLEGIKTPIYVEALVLAEVRVLKLVMDDGSYDVTIGQFGGVNCVRFLHDVDAMVGGQHLLKRTLLLLKSWCSYEAHILGGPGGYLGSYAATVMLISMLNTVEFVEDVEWTTVSEPEEGDSTTFVTGVFDRVALSPLVLFARFLKFFSYFDYERYCVTAFGPLRLTSISSTPYDLSQLEVSAARRAPLATGTSRASSASSLAGPPRGGEVDEHALGLTAEGEAAMGHRIRRRRRPLLTVSGVKHLLHEMNTSRERESRRRCEGRVTGASLGEEPDTPPRAGEAEAVRLDRPGSAAEDAPLLCPSCTTALFPVRAMNVLDPLRWSSNMVRGVCRNHLQRIQRAFREGLRRLQVASTELGEGASSSSPPPTPSTPSAASPPPSREGGTPAGSIRRGTPPLPLPPRRGSGPAGALGSQPSPGLPGLPAGAMEATRSGGYPAPHSLCTRREVRVLQYLFGNTIAMIHKYSAFNSPWGGPEESGRRAARPRCASCPTPSLFCVPNRRRLCEPQFTFAVPRADGSVGPSEPELAARRTQGPLGEEVVPPEPPRPAASPRGGPPHAMARDTAATASAVAAHPYGRPPGPRPGRGDPHEYALGGTGGPRGGGGAARSAHPPLGARGGGGGKGYAPLFSTAAATASHAAMGGRVPKSNHAGRHGGGGRGGRGGGTATDWLGGAPLPNAGPYFSPPAPGGALVGNPMGDPVEMQRNLYYAYYYAPPYNLPTGTSLPVGAEYHTMDGGHVYDARGHPWNPK